MINQNKKIEKVRSLVQNKALHLWFKFLSETFLEHGIDTKLFFKTFYKEGFELPISPIMVKEMIFRPVMDAYLKKNSTTKLNSNEIDEIVDIINKNLGEKFGKIGIEYIPFPSLEALEQSLNKNL